MTGAYAYVKSALSRAKITIQGKVPADAVASVMSKRGLSYADFDRFKEILSLVDATHLLPPKTHVKAELDANNKQNTYVERVDQLEGKKGELGGVKAVSVSAASVIHTFLLRFRNAERSNLAPLAAMGLGEIWGTIGGDVGNGRDVTAAGDVMGDQPNRPDNKSLLQITDVSK